MAPRTPFAGHNTAARRALTWPPLQLVTLEILWVFFDLVVAPLQFVTIDIFEFSLAQHQRIKLAQRAQSRAVKRSGRDPTGGRGSHTHLGVPRDPCTFECVQTTTLFSKSGYADPTPRYIKHPRLMVPKYLYPIGYTAQQSSEATPSVVPGATWPAYISSRTNFVVTRGGIRSNPLCQSA